MKKLHAYLFQPVDNTGIILLRILMGLLIIVEAVGALFTGWVHTVFIEPTVHFPFIGFEWLCDLLAGPQMYVWYGLMACSGLGIALGYRYKTSALLFALLWSVSYLMQKVHYNNHYYLMMLLSWVLPFMPLNQRLSFDITRKKTERKYVIHRYYVVFFIALLWILYSFASANKIHADWLAGKPISIWFGGKADYPYVGSILQNKTFQTLVVYGGIFFDGLVIPALLFRQTRFIALLISFGFHLFNSYVFQIGVFPYLSLAFSVLFFPTSQLRSFFEMDKWDTANKDRKDTEIQLNKPRFSKGMTVLWVSFMLIMIALPLRRHLFPGPVNWTEEGHRLSWRMMLRSKSGDFSLVIKHKDSAEVISIDPESELNRYTASDVATHPDMMWQYIQHVKKSAYAKGFREGDFEIYVRTRVSLNGRSQMPLIDPDFDMSKAEWNAWKTSPWIMPFKEEQD
jgi:vitamin K-dependent gamma-carboxylase